jgi:hypothetical protein
MIYGYSNYMGKNIDEMKVDHFIKAQQSSFIQILQNIVREKYNLVHLEDVDRQIIKVYKNAKISRQYFSKTRKRAKPTKKAVIRIGLSLKLSIERMSKFLKNSGYSLGIVSETDIVVRWCIENEIFDITKINEFLKKTNLKEI